MSTHPNVMLICAFTPDDLARRTHRAILAEMGVDPGGDDTDIKIGDKEYHTDVMESDYEEGYQISLPEGSIWVMDLVTYGYGVKVPWSELSAQKDTLETWAKGIAERHHCSYEIYIGANYW